MKILQVVQKPQRRGAEIFALQLARQLRSMGHDVRTAYLYPHTGGNALPLTEQDSVLGGPEHHYLEKLPGLHPVLLWRLRRVIATWRPDVVQVNGGRTLKYGSAASWYRSHPWVLISRSIGQPRRWLRGRLQREFYSRLVMPRVHGVVAVSSATLQGLTELYNLTVPTAKIPRGVDPATLVPSASPSVVRRRTQTPLDARVVLYVGSLTPEKRLDRLFRVVNTVRQNLPNLHLWIVGEGTMRATLETQARDMSLAPWVRFVGVQQDVASYMNAADVVALTSETEGMPGVLLEAGMLRRPVVATRVGGVSECVVNGETGVLVEPDDEQGFSDALSRLLQQPDDLRRLGNAAGLWIERHFTVGRIASQYQAFYESVLSGALTTCTIGSTRLQG
jgi:glycosyltransferase involved in cell wall biosynthesis